MDYEFEGSKPQFTCPNRPKWKTRKKMSES